MVHSRTCRRRRRALSLVELIVVIGIVGLLIALLMPALARSRESAAQVQCAANLRQLGQGLANYASNFRGYYPGWSGWHTVGGDGTGEDDPGPAWTEQLAPYYAKPDSRVYNCPAFPDGYPLNYFLSARYLNMVGRTNLLASEIRLSSFFVLSGDCSHPHLYAPPFGRAPYTTTDCDKDDAVGPGLAFFGEPEGMNMHRAGNNVLFADYHVAAFKRFDPERMTFHPRRMTDWEGVTDEQ